MSTDDPKRRLFVAAICTDYTDKDTNTPRLKHMKGHLGHVESILDQIMIAGPIFADDQKTVIGSMLVYKTDSVEEAKRYLEADPYFKADIWETIEFKTFRGALGEAVGGVAY